MMSRVAWVAARAGADAWHGVSGCANSVVRSWEFAACVGLVWMYATLGCGLFGYLMDITACIVLFWILVAPAVVAALAALGVGLRRLGRGLARWCAGAWEESRACSAGSAGLAGSAGSTGSAKDDQAVADWTDVTAPRVPVV